MKKIFLFLFISSLTYGQNIYVEYDFNNGYFTNTVLLIASKQNALKIKGALKISNDKNIKKTNEVNYEVIQKNITFKRREIYSTLKSNIYKIKKPLKNKLYNVIDSVNQFNWELIKGKTKKIFNYNCNLAKVVFRGREYFAYYTTEIPASFGPWKFKSLPGLILKIYSNTTNNEISWTAKKIVFPYNNKINLNWDKSLDSKLITYKQYINKLEKIIEKDNKITLTRVSKKGSKVKSSKPKRLGLELIYEWEEEIEEK